THLPDKGTKAVLSINSDIPEKSKLIVEKTVSLEELLGGGEKIKQEERVLLSQHPVRAQKFLLDECTSEKPLNAETGNVMPNEKKRPVYAGKNPCPRSHPLYELFRAYQFINNIEYGHRQKLSTEQREIILE